MSPTSRRDKSVIQSITVEPQPPSPRRSHRSTSQTVLIYTPVLTTTAATIATTSAVFYNHFLSVTGKN